MPLRISLPNLFPDDTNQPPASRSPEQAALLADELRFGDEGFLDRLRQLSGDAPLLYDQLGAACLEVSSQVFPGQSLRTLDLACGAGFVSLKLLELGLPVSSLTLADLSPELMRRARRILERRVEPERLPPIGTCELDLLVDDLDHRLEGTYDLVVCSNGFQHFPPQRQAELCRQIHRLLAPSGVLVLASHFKLLRPAWKEALVAGYLEELSRHQASEELLSNVAHHVRRFHVYVNLREMYEWLEQAGFGFYECVFRKAELGIFVAVK